MRDMPQDSIMDWVNNEESLYNDAQALYEKWTEEGDAWSEAVARQEARELAAHFSEAIEAIPDVEGKYTERDLEEAVDQMMEEFEEYREEAVKAVVKRERAPKAPEPMTPGEIEFAAKCEAIAQRIGIALLKELIPASPEQIRKALETGDKHLNTIPLRKWDQAALGIPYMKGLSLSDKVCALKHVAQWHYT
jgi:hypothetical protein